MRGVWDWEGVPIYPPPSLTLCVSLSGPRSQQALSMTGQDPSKNTTTHATIELTAGCAERCPVCVLQCIMYSVCSSYLGHRRERPCWQDCWRLEPLLGTIHQVQALHKLQCIEGPRVACDNGPDVTQHRLVQAPLHKCTEAVGALCRQ